MAILGIRYMLSLNDYKKYVPVIVAEDVKEQTAAYILENSASLTGVGLETGLHRRRGIFTYSGVYWKDFIR